MVKSTQMVKHLLIAMVFTLGGVVTHTLKQLVLPWLILLVLIRQLSALQTVALELFLIYGTLVMALEVQP